MKRRTTNKELTTIQWKDSTLSVACQDIVICPHLSSIPNLITKMLSIITFIRKFRFDSYGFSSYFALAIVNIWLNDFIVYSFVLFLCVHYAWCFNLKSNLSSLYKWFVINCTNLNPCDLIVICTILYQVD